jgi:DNA-binding transcriptional ArsR family regulator
MAKHQDTRPGDIVGVARALADPTRLRVLHALSKGELCVCQITELAALAPSTVSRHMSLLSGAGLVTSRKDGRWVYYRLPEEPQAQAAPALTWALEAFGSTEQARDDERELKRIVRCDPEQLCRRQRRS